MRVAALLLVGLLGLAGCAGTDGGVDRTQDPDPVPEIGPENGPDEGPAWTPGQWRDVPCDAAVPSSIPDLVARADQALHLLAWNATRYDVGPAFAHNISLFAAGATVAAFDGIASRLVLHDHDGTALASRDVSGVEALAVVGDLVYATYDRNLYVYDLQLELVSWLYLDMPGYPLKALDGILVRDGVAFILDDVVFPYYSFAVDVSDPRTPRDPRRFSLNGNSGLQGPWYDDGSWWVQSGFWGQGGGGVSLSRFDPAADGDSTAAHLALYTISSGYASQGHESSSGYNLQAWSHDVPFWAVRWGNSTKDLVHIDLGDEIRASCPLPSAGHSAIVAAPDHAVVLVDDAGLRVIAGAPPVVLYQQDLDLPIDRMAALSP